MKKILILTCSLMLFLLSGCDLSVSGEKLKIFTEVRKDVITKIDAPNHFYPIGDSNAKNKVIMFVDFDCEACHYLFEKPYKTIDKYVQSKEVKVYIYHLSFVDNQSTVKAVIAEFVKDRYPQYYPRAVEELGNLDSKSDLLQEKNLKTFFKSKFPNINLDDVENDIIENNKTYLAKIEQNSNLAKKYGVKYTPTIFVNGSKIKNPFNSEEIVKKIR